MTRPILVGYDPATSDHAPVEFAVAAAGFVGGPFVLSVQAGAPVIPVGRGRSGRSTGSWLGNIVGNTAVPQLP